MYILGLIFFNLTPGVPFKPSLKDVEEKNCGIYVTWESPPFESGGGPITGYQAQVQMQHDDWYNCTTSSRERTCLIEGLVNQAKYYVRVQAINRKGPSDWINGFIEASFTGNNYYLFIEPKWLLLWWLRLLICILCDLPQYHIDNNNSCLYAKVGGIKVDILSCISQ